MDKRDGLWMVLGGMFGALAMYLFANMAIDYECTSQREAITLPNGAVQERETFQRKFNWLPQEEIEFDIFGATGIQGAQLVENAE